MQWPEGRRWNDKTLGPESLELVCEPEMVPWPPGKVMTLPTLQQPYAKC